MFKIKEWFSHHHEDNAMEGHINSKALYKSVPYWFVAGISIAFSICDYGTED